MKPITKILIYPNPILLQKCEKIEDFKPWIEIIPIMFKIMRENNGCGLAAPQIGLPYCAFVLNVTKPLIVINPEILEVGDRLETEEEGCLSLPGQKFQVTRSRKIKVRWIDLKGKEKIEQYEGWTSRAWFHEFEHTQGLLINRFAI